MLAASPPDLLHLIDLPAFPDGRIQSKVQTLQDQLNDALGDLSLARRREEALKAEVAVTAAKLEDRGAELAKAQVGTGRASNHLMACDKRYPKPLFVGLAQC